MKSAYELAMERLNADDPNASKPLSDEQKEELAELDRVFVAKVAEREIFLSQRLKEAIEKNEPKEIEQIDHQIKSEKARLKDDLEEAKEKVRNR